MSSYADRITTSRRFTRVRRLHTGVLAFEGVLLLALMAYLIAADGPSLTPLYIPLGRALSLLLIMVLVITVESCLFRALAIRHAYKEAHKFLIADSAMGGSARTMGLAILLAVLLLLPMAQDASRVILSKQGSETVGPIQTFRLQFSNTDPLGITHSRTLTLRVDSGSLRVTLFRNGIPFNPGGTLLLPGGQLTWTLPLDGYAFYNATLENSDTGLSAFFTYDVKVGLPDNFATFVSYIAVLLAMINGAWYAYLRPIRKRYAGTSIYSSEYTSQATPEEAPFVAPRRPEDRPWYELEPQSGPATAPWTAPSARRHAVRAEATRAPPLPEIPPPPTEDAPEILTPPPPPPDLEVKAKGETILLWTEAAKTSSQQAARATETGETVQSLMERGREMLVAGNPPGALELFEKVLARDSGHIPAHLQRAEILGAEGRDQQALDSLEAVLGQDGRHHRALLLKAQILAGQERWEEALECYDKVAKGKPEYVEALRAKADILVKLGETEMAISCLEEASRLVPGDGKIASRLRSLQAEVAPAKGSQGQQTKPAQPAPAPLSEEKRTIQELQGKGIGYMHVGMYSDALHCFDTILGKEPNNGFALLSKARVLERLGRREAALESYKAALRVDPRDLNALGALADLLLRMGCESDALQYFERASEVDPKGGKGQERLQRYKEARTKLEEFLGGLSKEKGVPEALARSIAEGYASIKAVEATTLQELMAVKGMDVATARRIVEEARKQSKGP